MFVIHSMLKGTVKFYNEKTKFGFIREDETGKEYYVAEKDVMGNIKADDKVSFELKEAKRGPQCINVKKLED